MGTPGTTEFLQRYTPGEGDIVSFKHRGYMQGSGKPKIATLYRLRHDLSWQDVVNNWREHKSSSSSGIHSLFANLVPVIHSFLSTAVLPLKPTRKVIHPKGYWEKRDNRKAFFSEYARDAGFDPHDVRAWSDVTYSAFIQKPKVTSQTPRRGY